MYFSSPGIRRFFSVSVSLSLIDGFLSKEKVSRICFFWYGTITKAATNPATTPTKTPQEIATTSGVQCGNVGSAGEATKKKIRN